MLNQTYIPKNNFLTILIDSGAKGNIRLYRYNLSIGLFESREIQ